MKEFYEILRNQNIIEINWKKQENERIERKFKKMNKNVNIVPE
jgi:hypothetical protein